MEPCERATLARQLIVAACRMPAKGQKGAALQVGDGPFQYCSGSG
jgi:hypothetical protein